MFSELGAIACVYTKQVNGEMSKILFKDEFLGCSLPKGDKLIYIVDNYHAEFIFTNEKFSFSCFYNESDGYDHYINSKTKLAFITNCEIDPNEMYTVYKLGYFANVYSIEMPRINALIRKYDDIVMDTWGMKRKIDNEFDNAAADIFQIFSDCCKYFQRKVLSYDPKFIRRAPPYEPPFTPNKKTKIGKNQINIIDDYNSPPDPIPPLKLKDVSASILKRVNLLDNTIDDDEFFMI